MEKTCGSNLIDGSFGAICNTWKGASAPWPLNNSSICLLRRLFVFQCQIMLTVYALLWADVNDSLPQNFWALWSSQLPSPFSNYGCLSLACSSWPSHTVCQASVSSSNVLSPDSISALTPAVETEFQACQLVKHVFLSRFSLSSVYLLWLRRT